MVVDHFSRYAYFLPLKHPFTAEIVAKSFTRDVAKLHGFPNSIISDSHVFEQVLRGTLPASGNSFVYDHLLSPQIDGQTEVVNHCLETFLCFTL